MATHRGKRKRSDRPRTRGKRKKDAADVMPEWLTSELDRIARERPTRVVYDSERAAEAIFIAAHARPPAGLLHVFCEPPQPANGNAKPAVLFRWRETEPTEEIHGHDDTKR